MASCTSLPHVCSIDKMSASVGEAPTTARIAFTASVVEGRVDDSAPWPFRAGTAPPVSLVAAISRRARDSASRLRPFLCQVAEKFRLQ